jgi:hypothetical protein
MSIENKFHTGNMLVAYCKKKRIYKAALARKMNVDYRSIFYYFKRESMDLGKLLDFCHGLEHNFLLELALQLPSTYSSDVNTNAKDLEIATLKAHILTLETEKALLEKIVMK